MQNTENKFKHDGLWYIAVDGDGCRNCEFQSGWPNKCVLVPNCVSGQRGESIKTPVWTEIDRRSKKLPPVGVIVKWVNESYTAGTVGATYPDVGTDVLILAETDNANFSKKGVVFKWHTKHGVLTSFTTRAMDFSPIETPEEKAQRLRSEWCHAALRLINDELSDACDAAVIYDALLSGALSVPTKGGE